MADLTDEEIEALCDPENSGGYHTSRLVPMAREIKRHRAARAADTSDVKRDSEAEQALVRRFEPGGVRGRTAAEYGVLLGAARGAIDMAVRDADGNVNADNALEIMRKAIDTPARVADRERVRAVVRKALAEAVYSDAFAPRLDAIADRVAELLAGDADTARAAMLLLDGLTGCRSSHVFEAARHAEALIATIPGRAVVQEPSRRGVELHAGQSSTPSRAADRELIWEVISAEARWELYATSGVGPDEDAMATAIADRVVGQLAGSAPDAPSNPMEAWFRNNTRAPAATEVAPVVVLPPRREWDCEMAHRDGRTSATDYVDGWNGAIDAAERLTGVLHRMRKGIQYNGEFSALLDKLIAAHRKAP